MLGLLALRGCISSRIRSLICSDLLKRADVQEPERELHRRLVVELKKIEDSLMEHNAILLHAMASKLSELAEHAAPSSAFSTRIQN